MSDGTFAENFLDGFEQLNKRTTFTLKATKQLGSFFAKASEIQKEYMGKISTLCTQYKTKKLPLFDGSVQTGIASMVNELENVASAQKDFVEQLLTLKKDTEGFIKEKEKRQKALVQNSQVIVKNWRTQLDNLKKNRENYVKLAKEAASLQEQLKKKESDPTVKANVLSAATQKCTQAADKAKQAEKQYQDMLQQTNEKQTQHYEQEQPNLLKDFQQFEEDRIAFVKDLLERYAGFLDAIKMPDKWETSFNVVTSAVKSINTKEDISLFTEKNKTGTPVPQLIPFESWDGTSTPSAGTLSSSGSSSSSSTTPAAPSGGGKAPSFAQKPASGSQKTYGLTAADQNLGEEEKKKKLKDQLDEIEKNLAAENNQVGAVEKLIQFYAKDPQGKKSAEAQLAELNGRIDNLKKEKAKVEKELKELGGEVAGGDAGGEAPAMEEKGRALYDYDASNDSELSMKEGDLVIVSEKDPSGWWYATLGDKSGFVPANYVELL